MRLVVFAAFVALFVGHGFPEAAELPSQRPINEPEPFPSDLPRTITNSLGIKMNLIPAGKFTMGEGATAHEVTLTQPFYLGATEVTNAQGILLMGFTPSKWRAADHPVGNLKWHEALKFCEILSSRPAEKAAGRVYRLPTEAEWEFACRAGSTTTYSFGDDESLLGDFGWFDGNSNGKTHPVGWKQPNAWGLYDMHGNASEWCSDWYGDYAGGSATNPRGLSEGSLRVNRGGSRGSSAGACRSAGRGRNDPSSNYGSVGFRLALSPSRVKLPKAGK